ncbi:MAG TPA: hypothetical protein VI488_13275 [Candidatus Angelobacter sp.]
MRKIGWIAGCSVALLSVLGTFLYSHYQIQPLSGYPLDSASEPRKRVHKATDLFCREWGERPVSRIVIVELVQRTSEMRPLISINTETQSWPEAQERLKQIYSTRADRVVFLVDNANVDQRYRSELMDLMRQSPIIEDVCVIDPENPPSWYPPPDVRMPAVAAR